MNLTPSKITCDALTLIRNRIPIYKEVSYNKVTYTMDLKTLF